MKEYVAFEGEKVVGHLKVEFWDLETFAEAIPYGKL